MFKEFKVPLRIEGSKHNDGVTYVFGADDVELFRAYSARPELEEIVLHINKARFVEISMEHMHSHLTEARARIDLQREHLRLQDKKIEEKLARIYELEEQLSEMVGDTRETPHAGA